MTHIPLRGESTLCLSARSYFLAVATGNAVNTSEQAPAGVLVGKHHRKEGTADPRGLCNSFEEHGLCFKSQGLGLSTQPPLPEDRLGTGPGLKTHTEHVPSMLGADW